MKPSWSDSSITFPTEFRNLLLEKRAEEINYWKIYLYSGRELSLSLPCSSSCCWSIYYMNIILIWTGQFLLALSYLSLYRDSVTRDFPWFSSCSSLRSLCLKRFFLLWPIFLLFWSCRWFTRSLNNYWNVFSQAFVIEF